jgi:transposase
VGSNFCDVRLCQGGTGARRAAVLYSLLGTCRLNKVNPWEWLSDVLVRVNVRSEDTAVSLLPIKWKKKPVS